MLIFPSQALGPHIDNTFSQPYLHNAHVHLAQLPLWLSSRSSATNATQPRVIRLAKRCFIHQRATNGRSPRAPPFSRIRPESAPIMCSNLWGNLETLLHKVLIRVSRHCSLTWAHQMQSGKKLTLSGSLLARSFPTMAASSTQPRGLIM
jgi:hypothetical protein